MAGELLVTHLNAGETLYAIVRRASDMFVWNGTAFVVWVNANIALYDIPLVDKSGDIYQGDFPATAAAGNYRIVYYQQPGGAPTIIDVILASEDKHWNGAALVDVSVVTLSPYALTTVVKVKRLLHITATTDDDLLTELINAVTFKIERHCNRKFLARAYTERMGGYSTQLIVVNNWPLNTITAIYRVAGAGSDETTELLDATTYRFDSETGIINLVADTFTVWHEADFARGFRNYEVQYNGGYVTIPDDLDVVCRELVAAAYNLSKRDATLKSESLGDYSYALADAVAISDAQRDALRPWRSEPIGGHL